MNAPSETGISAATAQLTGAAMDRPLSKRRRHPAWRWGAGAAAAAVLIAGAWLVLPQGLSVPAASVRIGAVERGVFRDEVTVRSTAQSLQSTVLDAVDQGRVEEVLVKDGSLVKAGDLLFRMSNPQRRMELLQRESEQAQLLSNTSSFRVSFDEARSESARRLDQISYDLREAEKQVERNEGLAAQGFIAPTVLQDSRDKLAKLRRDAVEERGRADRAAASRQEMLNRLEEAAAGIHRGIELVTQNVAALAVRAPVSGRLTDFRLQVGETVRAGQRTGRIDAPGAFKLTASIDEFYLSRIATGHKGSAQINGKAWPVEVKETFPQVRDGRFTADLVFAKDAPVSLSPGQSVDLAITLGEPAQALLIPGGAYLNESAGAWVYVVDRDDASAQRRAVRLGRRSNGQAEVLSGLSEGERILTSSYAAYGGAQRLQLNH